MEPIDLSGAPNEWFLIAVPPVQVSTAMVYRVWSTAWREPNPYRGADDFVARWKAYGDVPYHNGLWRAAAEAAPVLESYRKLLPGFLWTLTGSGSAFYVPLREKGDSDKLLYRIPREAGFSTYLVRR
jgi:4-diphosphocytidyl-2C-methyl-D-erythritol kinase